jgi:hypothetical protein
MINTLQNRKINDRTVKASSRGLSSFYPTLMRKSWNDE